MKVEDVMTREVFTVPPGASLKDAAHLLVEHRISGLPVVDNQNHVLGVVSEADVLPKEAAGLQLHSPLAWLDRHSVQVEVEGGEVTLTGRLDSRADAQSLEALVRRVPGVVGAPLEAAWTDDDTEC